MRPFRRRRIRFRAPVVRRIDGRRAVAVRWVLASPDQASGPIHVFQASSLGPLGCEASGLTPSPPVPRSDLINRFGPANRGAEGGTRTRTARRPLAPQGFVRLPRASLVFPSVAAPTGAKSDAKASAQRPTESRPSVANRRHPDCNDRYRIRETDSHCRAGDKYPPMKLRPDGEHFPPEPVRTGPCPRPSDHASHLESELILYHIGILYDEHTSKGQAWQSRTISQVTTSGPFGRA